jgi:hypothetical protein
MANRNNKIYGQNNWRMWYFRMLSILCILEMLFIILLCIISLFKYGIDVWHLLIAISSTSIIIGLLFTFLFKRTGAVIVLVSSIGILAGLIFMGTNQPLLLHILILLTLIILPLYLGLVYLLFKDK